MGISLNSSGSTRTEQQAEPWARFVCPATSLRYASGQRWKNVPAGRLQAVLIYLTWLDCRSARIAFHEPERWTTRVNARGLDTIEGNAITESREAGDCLGCYPLTVGS